MPWIIILTPEIMWYRVWKGTFIFGIRDLTKIQWEWENAKYLDQKQNLTATQEVGSTKILFGHGMWEFFASLSGIWELRKWAGKYRERGRRNPLHSPSSLSLFLSSTFSPMLQHSEVSKRQLNFCNFLKLTCVNTKY